MDFERTLFAKVTGLLNRMGVPAYLSAYNYIREAIIILVMRNLKKPLYTCRFSITKEIYPVIAEKYGTTTANVERRIRTIIKKTCEEGNFELLNKIFYYIHDIYTVTNKQFFIKVTDYIGIEIINEAISPI